MNRDILSKCETMALHRGKRISYDRSNGKYKLLSYDCLTTHFTGSLSELFEHLKNKTL